MAREARKLSKSGCYYVVLKGEELYKSDADKKMFMEILERNFATGLVHGCEITKDEIRLVVKEGERGISMTMKPIVTSYARYYNRTYNREGKLFLGRFKSEPLETQAEIEESLKNIKKPSAKKRTAPVKKTVTAPQTKKPTPKKEETKKQEQPKRAAALPSWLL